MKSTRLSFFTLVALVFLLATVITAAPVQVGHVRADLIAETSTIQPGAPFRVALHMVLDDHWHVYWENPGDAGLPPTIDWDLPEGFTAGDFQWPYPERINVGPLTDYGYSHEVVFPVQITPPANLMPGTPVELKAKVDWLVCEDVCIPGEAALTVTLPVGDKTPARDTETRELFARTDFMAPVDDVDVGITATLTDTDITLNFNTPAGSTGELDSVLFFPRDKQTIKNSAPQVLTRTENGYELTLARSKYLTKFPDHISGLLVTPQGWFASENSEQALAVTIPVSTGPPPVAVASTTLEGILKALLFAFLGGMILNLMPCVLPVLSLKILGFVNQAGEAKGTVFRHGLVFTLGVLISFWVLAGALLILRAGGEQLGWGFQLQSPGFLVVLSGFMFLFGLNLLGVFEIGTSLTGVGSGSGRKEGMLGSFVNGVTATVVATPCTAPFMGSALGFSLSQPPFVAVLIFTALGLGMAAPYLLLSAMPSLLRFVPKPGRWMESMKQIMGFLLLATVIWLVWVLGIQAGVNAVTVLMGALLIIGVGAWVLGRWGTLAAETRTRRLAYVISAVLVFGSVGLALNGVNTYGVTSTSATVASNGELAWEPFTPERYAEVRESGVPLFIDFTAAWCLSCQVNEQVAFGSEDVQKRFAELGVVTMKADWTARDAAITTALARYGRNSVPLYVLYPGSGNGEPTILPEIITPGIVLEALNHLEG